MTDRIYYTDPMCGQFVATVVDHSVRDGRHLVRLDRTAFYPTSGGQPFDTGVLGSARVVDVVDEGRMVIHVLDGPLSVGSSVSGLIDWPRRFDHMQQHTGQHILSATFERLLGNATISFHMGTEAATIDLAAELRSTEDLERVEAEANRIVWSDMPVAIRFVSSEEAERLPLRKEPSRGGTLRLIDIDGVDLSACGGTHVRRTGAVGVIAVLGTERFKGGTRVTFACGGRALRSHRLLRTVVADSIRVLSVVPSELPAAIERLQTDAKDQKKIGRDLRDRLAVHDAHALLEGAQDVAGVRVVVRALEGYDASGLKSLVVALAASPRVAAVLFTAVLPAQVVVARSTDVSCDASAILKALVTRFGGKGGGKADLAQGGGLAGDVREMLWAASGLLEDAAR